MPNIISIGFSLFGYANIDKYSDEVRKSPIIKNDVVTNGWCKIYFLNLIILILLKSFAFETLIIIL